MMVRKVSSDNSTKGESMWSKTGNMGIWVVMFAWSKSGVTRWVVGPFPAIGICQAAPFSLGLKLAGHTGCPNLSGVVRSGLEGKCGGWHSGSGGPTEPLMLR